MKTITETLLTDYLTREGWGSATRLSDKSGLSKSYISDLASGRCGQRLTVETARALEKGTGIKATVWLGLEPPARKRARA